MMNEFIRLALASLGGATVAVVMLSLLMKTWITARIQESVKNEYAKKLERYKADLQKENAKELEDYRATLSQQNAKELEDYKSSLQKQNLVLVEAYKVTVQKESAQALHDLQVAQQKSEAWQIADKTLFKRFLAALPSNGAIAFIDRNNFAGFSFDWDELEDLRRFDAEWGDAEHEFLHPELEKRRRELHALIGKYITFLGLNTWRLKDGSNRSSVPQEWEDEQPERFNEIVSSIHDQAGIIVAAHQELVRAAKEHLNM